MSKDTSVEEEYARRVVNTKSWLDMTEQFLFAASRFEEDIINYYKESFSAHKREGKQNLGRKSIESIRLHNTYFMLLSFAVENTLKAGIVKTNRDSLFAEALKKRILPKLLKSHDLLDLANNSGLTLSMFELHLLKRLEMSILWTGRYPVPVKAEDIVVRDELGKPTLFKYFSSKDIDDLKALMSKVVDKFGFKLKELAG